MVHFQWNYNDPMKNVVQRGLHRYGRMFYEHKLASKDEVLNALRNYTVIINPAESNNDSIMLANRIEMNWVIGDLFSNFLVLTQEFAHYMLWKLGYPKDIWGDFVHERWEERKPIIIWIWTMNWKLLMPYRIPLRALDVFGKVIINE